MAFLSAGGSGGEGSGRERFPPLRARQRAMRGSGESARGGLQGEASSSDSGCDAPTAAHRRPRGQAAEPWGAAALPVLRRGEDGPAPPAPPSTAASTLLSQLQVPVGIGIPGSTATIPASITSPEHLAAYAEYCKRALSNAVNGPLLGKRDAIAHQLARVQARADELRGIARETERGVRSAAEDCVEALRGAESRRLLQLHAQADELRRQLEAVQRCAEAAAVACAGSEPPLAFLDKFATLSDACERLSAKPVREHIEVDAETFEREARAAAAGLPDRDAEVLSKLLAVKDEMIWALVEERDALRAAQQQTLQEVGHLRAALGELRRAGSTQ